MIDNIADQEKLAAWESTIARAARITRIVQGRSGGKVRCYCTGGASRSLLFQKKRKEYHLLDDVEIQFIDNPHSGAFGACVYAARLKWNENLGTINQL